MLLLSRLYRLARARFGAAKNFDSWESPQEPFSRDFEEGFTSGGSTTREPAAEESVKDPKLARAWANLELPYGTGPDEVEKAWKRLSRMYHPDRHATDPQRERMANQLMQGINQAHETLQRHFGR